MASVAVSGTMLRQRFHPCEEGYIKAVCRGRCCQGTGKILVTVHPTEQGYIERMGATVQDGFIVADARGLCPFKTDGGLCSIHGDHKPFGCRASPFTLTHKGTLIIRNRYRLLRCYGSDGSVPAYEAHLWSLGQIFGRPEAARIAQEAREGAPIIWADMPDRHYHILLENDAAKRSKEAHHAEPA